MEQQWDLWASLQAGIPASHSASPGSVEARTMTAISGLRCIESSKNSGPLGLLEKTLMGTSRWGSTVCALTWSEVVTPSGRLVYRLSPSAPTTVEHGSGLWPTATVGDSRASGSAGLLDGERPTLRHDADGCGGSRTLADTAWDEQGRQEQRAERERARASCESKPLANAYSESPGRLAEPRTERCEWEPEPDVGRVAHGVPSRVDRLKALGNAIVPQVAEEIFRAINLIRV
jgi:hypothetical protein